MEYRSEENPEAYGIMTCTEKKSERNAKEYDLWKFISRKYQSTKNFKKGIGKPKAAELGKKY